MTDLQRTLGATTDTTPRAWNSTLPARTDWMPRGAPLSTSATQSRSGGSKPRPRPSKASNSHPTAAVRKLVLERDGHACVCCGVSVVGRPYSLGHRLRASQGGKAVPSNLLVFLGLGGQMCHGRIDNREDPEDEVKGYTIRMDGSPLLVPVMFFEPGGSGALVYLADDGTVSATPPSGDAA